MPSLSIQRLALYFKAWLFISRPKRGIQAPTELKNAFKDLKSVKTPGLARYFFAQFCITSCILRRYFLTQLFF
jgi:hypothetical protein